MKEKPIVGFFIFGTFPSDRIPKATKDVNVHSFIHSSNTSKLYERIPEGFISYYLLTYLLTYSMEQSPT